MPAQAKKGDKKEDSGGESDPWVAKFVEQVKTVGIFGIYCDGRGLIVRVEPNEIDTPLW